MVDRAVGWQAPTFLVLAHWAAQCWAAREKGSGGARSEDEDGSDGRTGASDGCRFPDHWQAAYFLGGSRDAFNIGDQNFGTEGFCFRQHASNKFTVYNRPNKCFRCIQVIELNGLATFIDTWN